MAKRTVKCWVNISPPGHLIYIDGVFIHKKDAQRTRWWAGPKPHSVRALLTYDDGKPARARRARKGGKSK